MKTSDRRAILGSGTITYTLRVTNNGPGVPSGVQVIDTPSLPVKLVSVRASAGSCTTTVPIRCDLGTLQVGASATVTVVAQPMAPGTLRNSASVTGSLPDPRTGNNVDGTTTKVQGLLKVRKVASRSTVRAGETLRYRIAVSNASAFALRSVKVCDDLPTGLVFVSATPKATRAATAGRSAPSARSGARPSRSSSASSEAPAAARSTSRRQPLRTPAARTARRRPARPRSR